jgi:hypothetical protein
MWNNFFIYLSSLPDFIQEAIISLFITVVGGVIVAYFVSRYFEKINEVTRLKGIIIEKRIEVYAELAKKLEALNNMIFFHAEQIEPELEVLKQIGYKGQFEHGVKINDVFDDNETLHKRFLDFERYSNENRLFYDSKVYDEVNFLQNYFCLYAHLQILFSEQLNTIGKDPDSEYNKSLLNHVVRTVGILLSEDFASCISTALEAIRYSMLNVTLDTRHEQLHTYGYYNNPDGPFMQRLMSSEAGKRKDDICYIVHAYVILAK